MKIVFVFISTIQFLLTLNTQVFSQSNFYNPLKLDTVKWTYGDLGKMWTFDNVPLDDFEEKYGFHPSDKWLNNVQKSALQFGEGCSAAFVSEDGLIMTNHHCGRNKLSGVQEEGEDLLKDGFYAENIEQERKINKLYVDQLIIIEDVTEIIKNHMKNGNSDDEKVQLRNEMKDSLVNSYHDKTGLLCKVVTLYHGGKYSLYGYKRYDDIRLVMAPDFQIAATGWDWDNFTYPRYELDFMFYRAYDEYGKPVKNNSFFKWSKSGATEDDLLFVVGRPGSTNRLYSIAQLEYLRDYDYPNLLIGYNAIYDVYLEYYFKYPERKSILNNVMKWGNSRKSYAGRLSGLNDEYIMSKKRSFEYELRSRIKSSTELKNRYGNVWEEIEDIINELKNYSVKDQVLRFHNYIKPEYYNIAQSALTIASQKDLPNDERDEEYKDDNLAVTIDEIYPEGMDGELQNKLLLASIRFLNGVLEADDPILLDYLQNKNGNDALQYLMSESKLFTKDGFIDLVSKKGDEIKASNDPFIIYLNQIKEIIKEVEPKIKQLNNSLSILNEFLGEAVYEIFGDKIPPDATSTLRISEGYIEGYKYNGTIAPGKTTYYGLWDRYESFNKKTYPWGLHEKWEVPPKNLDLSTAIGFASTNDIVGGNSGSSVINKNMEVVGLVHDGNIESLAGHTIFLEENNRAVSTDSKGLIDALKYVYKTEPLVKELLKGKRE